MCRCLFCEWEGDVVAVVAPLSGVAQVVSHGVKVVGVHGEEGKEKDEVQGCSVLHVAHVVLCVVVLVGVGRVTVVIVHIGLEDVVVVIQFCVAIFVVIFCIRRCTLSVTVDCVDCYQYNHDKLCTKFLLRFIPQMNRRFTDCHRFHRSISVHSIFVVKSHNRDATRLFAIATMRRNCATNFHSARCPPIS